MEFILGGILQRTSFGGGGVSRTAPFSWIGEDAIAFHYRYSWTGRQVIGSEHAPPHHATPCRPCYAMSTPHTTPRHATPRHATPRHATPRHATPQL